MNRNQFFLIAMLSITLLCSCKKDWLDVKTDKNLLIPSNLKDFEALLDNVNVINTYTPGLGEIASDGHYIPNNYWQLESNTEKNAYTWSHNQSYSQIADWIKSYQKIFYCNVVIDGLKKMTSGEITDQGRYNNIMGNALFHRAKNFYELAQLYAQPYRESTAANDLGIPVRLTSDVTIPSTRSSVNQTYEQIVSDLLAAKDLLPVAAAFKTRASKATACALLARTYLIMGDFTKAHQFADSCLSYNSRLLDYNTLNPSASYIGYNPEVLTYTEIYLYYTITLDAIIDSSLYASYSSNDLRKVVFFKVSSNGTITFKGRYDNIGLRLWSGLATDEIYLIRAECNARMGNTSSAMSDLNALLITRWKTGTFVPFAAANADDALAQILAERKKELLMRGIRWSDLRRLNQESKFAITLSRTIGGQTYTLEPNSFKYTFPLPDDIIQQTKIEQNPGW